MFEGIMSKLKKFKQQQRINNHQENTTLENTLLTTLSVSFLDVLQSESVKLK